MAEHTKKCEDCERDCDDLVKADACPDYRGCCTKMVCANGCPMICPNGHDVYAYKWEKALFQCYVCDEYFTMAVKWWGMSLVDYNRRYGDSEDEEYFAQQTYKACSMCWILSGLERSEFCTPCRYRQAYVATWVLDILEFPRKITTLICQKMEVPYPVSK